MMRRSTSFLSRTREAGPSSEIAFPPEGVDISIDSSPAEGFLRPRRNKEEASLTYDNVGRRRGSADGTLRHGGVAAARHARELGLRHHLQPVAALPSSP